LEKASKIIKFNRQPNTTMPTKLEPVSIFKTKLYRCLRGSTENRA